MSKHIIVSGKAGDSFLTSEAQPPFEDMDFSGWQGLAIEKAGIFMFNISANAVEFPLHTSDLSWSAYVISGSGTLFSGNKDLEKSDSILYKSGDFITFEADTPHAWKSDNVESRIIFIQDKLQKVE